MKRLNQYEVKVELKNIFKCEKNEKIENYFKQFKPNTLAVASGRSAVFIILKEIEKKYGVGEVITSNYSCKVIPRAIISAGFKPVFVDIDKKISLNMNKVKEAINENTKAILIWHPYGFINNLEIFEFAKKKKIPVIEDCGQSFAEVNGKKVGNFGDYSFFSFRTSKFIHAGSGAIICSDKKIEQKLKRYSCFNTFFNIGDIILRKILNKSKPKAIFDHFFDKVGSYSMGKIEKDIAVSQLENLEVILKKRRENYKILSKEAKKLGIKQIEFEKCKPTPLCFPILVEPSKKDKIVKIFRKKWKIAVMLTYNHVNSDFFDCKTYDDKNSREVADSIIDIPVNEFLTEKDLERIKDALRDISKI